MDGAIGCIGKQSRPASKIYGAVDQEHWGNDCSRSNTSGHTYFLGYAKLISGHITCTSSLNTSVALANAVNDKVESMRANASNRMCSSVSITKYVHVEYKC